MIDFQKSPKKVLPYDRTQYIEFLNDDTIPSIKWYGVSFQLPGVFEGKDIGLSKFVKTYNDWFKNVISIFDNGSSWIVNHDDKDLKWFPTDGDNLPYLRTLFKKRNVPNSFKGALIFTKEDLLKFSQDLISYPYSASSKDGFLYKNIDISYGQLPFILKISGHLTIDLLSTNKDLLKKMVNENSSNIFIVKKYRGTSLD